MTSEELLQQDLEYRYGKGVKVIDCDEILIVGGKIIDIKNLDK